MTSAPHPIDPRTPSGRAAFPHRHLLGLGGDDLIVQTGAAGGRAIIDGGDGVTVARQAGSPNFRIFNITASMNVVFPAPFGPIKPTISPFRTSRSTFPTAVSPPYLTVKPEI